jgi:hypothetical protein
MASALNPPTPLAGTKKRHPSRPSTIHSPLFDDGMRSGRPRGTQLGGLSETLLQKPLLFHACVE